MWATHLIICNLMLLNFQNKIMYNLSFIYALLVHYVTSSLETKDSKEESGNEVMHTKKPG